MYFQRYCHMRRFKIKKFGRAFCRRRTRLENIFRHVHYGNVGQSHKRTCAYFYLHVLLPIFSWVTLTANSICSEHFQPIIYICIYIVIKRYIGPTQINICYLVENVRHDIKLNDSEFDALGNIFRNTLQVRLPT